MPKTTIHIVTAFLVLVILYSCTCPCLKADLQFGLIGFSDAEADTIVLRKYEKSSNFNAPKDSFFFHDNDIRFSRLSDTLQPVAHTSDAVLDINFDYEFYFPESQKLFRITEITEWQSEQSCGIFSTNKKLCVNEINTCKINGITERPSRFNKIYLRK